MTIGSKDGPVRTPSGSGSGRATDTPRRDDTTASEHARQALLLNRTRALTRLQTACSPAQRSMLEQSIADIDAQLARNEGRQHQE